MKVRVLSVLFAIFVCGCSLQHSVPPPQVPMGRDARSVSADTSIPALAVSTSTTLHANKVELFNAMFEKIAQMPAPIDSQLAFDAQGDLYLSPVNLAEVLVYAPPYTQPPTKINLPGSESQVAVDRKTGVFAVVALPAGPVQPSKVLFFRHGTTKPCSKVLWKLGNLNALAAFDAEGTLFTDVGDANGTSFLTVPGECAAKTIQSGPFISSETGIMQFNAKDQLVIATYDRSNHRAAILTYPHPKGGVLGKPISKTVLVDINGNEPLFQTLASDGKTLWATDLAGTFAQYNYPAGGTPVKVFHVFNGYWMNVYPQLVP